MKSSLIPVIAAFGLLAWAMVGCSGDANPSGPNESGNQPPVIQSIVAEPEQIRVGELARIEAAATDPEGDELSYFWSAEFGYVLGSGKNVSYTAPDCCIGDNVIELKVTDPNGGVAESLVMVKVRR